MEVEGEYVEGLLAKGGRDNVGGGEKRSAVGVREGRGSGEMATLNERGSRGGYAIADGETYIKRRDRTCVLESGRLQQICAARKKERRLKRLEKRAGCRGG
jgi:hypothetical protein